MARIRSIKPEFWSSEQIAECSPNARLMFIGMWSFCDDYGVHPSSIARLKMEVFPSDAFAKEDIRHWMDELIANDLIVEYESDGKTYWYVTGWEKHQRPDTKTGKYPLPSGEVGKKIRRTNTERTPNAPQQKDELSANGLRTFTPGEGEGEGEGDKSPLTPQGGAGDANPPSAKNEDPPITREVAIAKMLRDRGIDANPFHPELVSWAQTSVTDADILGAFAIAREVKPEPEVIPMAYLAKIVPKVVSDRLSGGKAKPIKTVGPVSGSVPDPSYPYGNILRPRSIQ